MRSESRHIQKVLEELQERVGGAIAARFGVERFDPVGPSMMHSRLSELVPSGGRPKLSGMSATARLAPAAPSPVSKRLDRTRIRPLDASAQAH